ncbi:MAG: MATE family efflux transporter [Ahrensia sp.]
MNVANEKIIITNRTVLAIAVPMTLAFLTTPLLGIVDTAVVGQFGDAAMIGGLAVGAIIFDVVFTTFNFLRTGTTGFVAQAMGRNDATEQQAIFWRAIMLAVGIGVLFVLISPWLQRAGLLAMAAAPAVGETAMTYMSIRFLATPFALVNYVILGVLLGQGRAMATFVLQALINGINIVLSLTLGLWMGWGVVGVAWATVIGETVVAIGAFLWIYHGFDRNAAPGWARIIDRASFLRLIAVNRDIMIRSFALLAAFFLFTRFGGQFGTVTLAANAILMNFFLLSAYFLDGLSAAAEQLAGRTLGAQQRDAFRQAIKRTCTMGFALSGVAALVILVAGGAAIDVMTTAANVQAAARDYLFWAALTALTGVLAFQMDGIYIGATWSVDMRNMMLLSLAVFVALAWLLMPVLGNHGLWLALNGWLALRGLSLLVILPRRMQQSFAA